MNMKDVRSIVGEGLRRVRQTKQPDSDVSAYEKLQPADFPHLFEKFGVEPVLTYIRAMERKRKVTDGMGTK